MESRGGPAINKMDDFQFQSCLLRVERESNLDGIRAIVKQALRIEGHWAEEQGLAKMRIINEDSDEEAELEMAVAAKNCTRWRRRRT